MICDLDHAEGVLPFAILSRADRRLLVSSNYSCINTPLGHEDRGNGVNSGGRGQLAVIISETSGDGLKRDQVIDYLIIQKGNDHSLPIVHFIPFDARGARWVGTGNSFYTESSTATQLQIELVLRSLLKIESETSSSSHGVIASACLRSV